MLLLLVKVFSNWRKQPKGGAESVRIPAVIKTAVTWYEIRLAIFSLFSPLSNTHTTTRAPHETSLEQFFSWIPWRGLLTSRPHRWVPKVKDGLTFGMEHPEIVELEEERWALLESILKVKDGEG